jgi:hypothetical protein
VTRHVELGKDLDNDIGDVTQIDRSVVVVVGKGPDERSHRAAVLGGVRGRPLPLDVGFKAVWGCLVLAFAYAVHVVDDLAHVVAVAITIAIAIAISVPISVPVPVSVPISVAIAITVSISVSISISVSVAVPISITVAVAVAVAIAIAIAVAVAIPVARVVAARAVSVATVVSAGGNENQTKDGEECNPRTHVYFPSASMRSSLSSFQRSEQGR